MVFRSNENESLKIRPAESSRHWTCTTRVLPWLRRSVAAPISRPSHGERGNDGSRYGSRHRGHRPRAAHVQEIADAEEAGGAVVCLPPSRDAPRLFFSSHARRKFPSRFHRARRIACRPSNPSARSLTRRDSCKRFPRPIGVIARADRTRFIAPAPAWTRRAKYEGLRRRAQVQGIRARPRSPPDADPHVLRRSRRGIPRHRRYQVRLGGVRRRPARRLRQGGRPAAEGDLDELRRRRAAAIRRSPSFAKLVEDLNSEASGPPLRAPPRSTSCRGTA